MPLEIGQGILVAILLQVHLNGLLVHLAIGHRVLLLMLRLKLSVCDIHLKVHPPYGLDHLCQAGSALHGIGVLIPRHLVDPCGR